MADTAPISTKLSHSINLYKYFIYQILSKSNDICKKTWEKFYLSPWVKYGFPSTDFQKSFRF
jgi:hypothetical protein